MGKFPYVDTSLIYVFWIYPFLFSTQFSSHIVYCFMVFLNNVFFFLLCISRWFDVYYMSTCFIKLLPMLSISLHVVSLYNPSLYIVFARQIIQKSYRWSFVLLPDTQEIKFYINLAYKISVTIQNLFFPLFYITIKITTNLENMKLRVSY